MKPTGGYRIAHVLKRCCTLRGFSEDEVYICRWRPIAIPPDGLLLAQKPLVRLTRTAILREAGATWALWKLALPPLTSKALERVEENRTQFAVRRIQAASCAEMGNLINPAEMALGPPRKPQARSIGLGLKPVEAAIDER